MAVERVSGGSSLIDVLDRVLDKGIVIDAWVRISLVKTGHESARRAARSPCQRRINELKSCWQSKIAS